MGHWYNSIGEPCYNAGLREARKQGYLPSVTTIDKIISNPGLDTWKQNVIIETCIANPFKGEIDDKEYIDWIKKEAFRDSRQKAKLGTVVHHLAERYIQGKPLFFQGARSDVWEIFQPLKDWIDINLMEPKKGVSSSEGCEIVLVNENFGYAGKADLLTNDTLGNLTLLDYKTTFLTEKDIKKDGTLKKVKIYPSWGRQLAALNEVAKAERVLSVVISTNKDFLGVWIVEWTQKELDKYFEEFHHALILYRLINKL